MESKEELSHQVQEVLVETVDNYERISSVSFTTMDE
jgi:hypothetical protein